MKNIFRTGNMVNAGGVLAEVVEIHEKGLIVKTIERISPETFSGIAGLEITENRLTSIGFDSKRFNVDLNEYTFESIGHSAKIIQHENDFYYKIDDLIRSVRFIHEIQNLHFYLNNYQELVMI